MASLAIALSHLWATIVATLVWLIAWGTTVLLIYIPLIPIAIIAALLNIPYQEWIVTGLFLIGPIYLIRFLRTPAVRFGLRIAPLPSGRTTRKRVPTTLIVGWGFALALAVANDADWQSLFTLCVAAPAAACRIWSMNRDWAGAPKGRFVLFLRRFGKSADRLVGSAIRGAVPDGATLAFLVGRQNTGESWDPFLVGYEGLQSIPLYLNADDQEWVERVRFLVDKADAIVIDVSDWSDAMEIEARIIRESSAADKTIVLSRSVATTIAAREVINYHRSWRVAYERIFWGLVATVGLPLVIHATAVSSEYPDPVLAVPLVALWIWLFVRPLMDKQSSEALKVALKTILTN